MTPRDFQKEKRKGMEESKIEEKKEMRNQRLKIELQGNNLLRCQ